MRKEFQKEVEESLFIHSMLPLHQERSLEAAFPAKRVAVSKSIWNGDGGNCIPDAEFCREDEYDCIRIHARVSSPKWPAGAPEDGDYSNYGRAEVHISMDGEDWSSYNRLHFWVKPQVFGAGAVHLNVSVRNEGKIKIPDPMEREGFTTYNLKNNQWNECFWEFPGLPRDRITDICFFVLLNGRDLSMDDSITYFYRDISLECVEGPEKERGWECEEGRIILSAGGYLSKGRKTAIVGKEAGCFCVKDVKSGDTVYESETSEISGRNGDFHTMDFSEVIGKGAYYIQTGRLQSPIFYIGDDMLEEHTWRIINFLYGERCGMPVWGRHGTCHEDIMAEHGGVSISYSGGWHDAGDVSQQTVQTGEIVHALLEAASRYKEHSIYLYRRLLEEAGWGLDFLLKTRFGDGYRATSAGMTRWTDCRVGNMDDGKARVYNHAYENFLCAGVEAYAYLRLLEDNEALAWGSLQAAEEDFRFAMERYETHGMEPEQMYEHTYSSGASQYYAVIVWAASCLLEATGNKTYGNVAEVWCDRLMACQETGGEEIPIQGFYYRDETHRQIVHYNHQSREHQFMQAMTAICRTQPDSPKRCIWEKSMTLYGGYLKAISKYTAPYGMLPAGIYKKDEYMDRKLFPYMHLLCDYEKEKENYKKQLEAGAPVGDSHVIRNFPIWFSFRGNNAVLLSAGKAASLLGRYEGDEELLEIGREQLYWILGKNPFAQPLLYGAGTRFASQYAVFPGEMEGAIPVGIETYGNDDSPYWPQSNYATYREVWTSCAGRWLWLAADFI